MLFSTIVSHRKVCLTLSLHGIKIHNYFSLKIQLDYRFASFTTNIEQKQKFHCHGKYLINKPDYTFIKSSLKIFSFQPILKQ